MTESYRIPSPFGSIRIEIKDGQLDAVMPSLEVCSNPAPIPEEAAYWQQVITEVIEGPRALKRDEMDKLINTPRFQTLSEFQKSVLIEVMFLEPGEFITYKMLSERLKRPSTSRSGGNVLAKNPFPVLIGCHRVVPHAKLKSLDIANPQSFKPQAYLGTSELVPVGQWLRLNDLGAVR